MPERHPQAELMAIRQLWPGLADGDPALGVATIFLRLRSLGAPLKYDELSIENKTPARWMTLLDFSYTFVRREYSPARL